MAVNKSDLVRNVQHTGVYQGYKEYIEKYKAICPYCHQEYVRYVGEIDYEYDGLKFCSWTCKCRYRKKKEQEKHDKEMEELYELFSKEEPEK